MNMDRIILKGDPYVTPENYQSIKGFKSLKTVYNKINSGELITIKFLGKTLVKL